MKAIVMSAVTFVALTAITGAKPTDKNRGNPAAVALLTEEEAAAKALAWLEACRTGKLDAALASSGNRLAVGERNAGDADWDLKIIEGKDAIKELLAAIKRGIADKKKFEVESAAVVEQNKLPGGGALPKQMDDCRFVVTLKAAR